MRAVVTGGASGIGEEITLFLLKSGYEVFFTYLKGADSADEICKLYASAQKYKIDFTQPEEMPGFLEEIEKYNPDILINNYYNGTFIDSYFHKTDSESFAIQFTGNIVPTLKITQKYIAVFRKKKFGRIINILSSSLRQTAMGTSIYNSNKAYLLQMGKHWASENVKFGITCNSISPAFVLTDFHKDMHEVQKEMMISSYPVKEKLSTQEIADFVGLCISGGIHFTGNHIFLDASNS